MRDFVKKKTVLVKAGKKYVARAQAVTDPSIGLDRRLIAQRPSLVTCASRRRGSGSGGGRRRGAVALAVPGSRPRRQFPGIFTVDTTADGNDGECTRRLHAARGGRARRRRQRLVDQLPPGVYSSRSARWCLQQRGHLRRRLRRQQQRRRAHDGHRRRGTRPRARGAPAGSSAIVAGVTITGGTARHRRAARSSSAGADAAPLQRDRRRATPPRARGGGVASRRHAHRRQHDRRRQPRQRRARRRRRGRGDGNARSLIASTVSGNSATATGGGIIYGAERSSSMTHVTIAGNTPPAAAASTRSAAAARPRCGTRSSPAPRRRRLRRHDRQRSRTSAGPATSPTTRTCAFAAGRGHAARGPAARRARRNNGGPTDTHALARRQPGDQRRRPNACLAQRPARRGAASGACDIGAFEFGGNAARGRQLPPPVAGQDRQRARAERAWSRSSCPGSDEFFELKDGQQIPVGTTFDTRKGRVHLVSAADKTGATQTAWFYDGHLQGRPDQGRQAAHHAHAGRASSAARAAASANAAAKKKKKRQLWGDGKGKFRTTGQFSSATVRGTKWLVEDRCDGTLTQVKRGHGPGARLRASARTSSSGPGSSTSRARK